MNDELVDRPLPQSVDAERAILGAILIDCRVYWRIANLIDVADFFKDAHRTIFAAIKAIVLSQREPDLITLKDELGPKLQDVGGPAYLASLTSDIPDIMHVEREYVSLVVRDSQLRRQIVAGNSMMRAALDPDADPQEITAAALKDLSTLSSPARSQSRPLASILRDLYDEQQRILDGDTKLVDVIVTGHCRLDAHRAIKRVFGTIVSPSNHGKTALMVNLASAIAANGYKVAIFTLESTQKDIGWRYVATEGQIAHTRAQDWRFLHKDERRGLATALTSATRRAIHVCRDIRNVDAIVAECRRLQMTSGLDIAFVDYIQLVEHSRRFDRDDLKFAAIAQAFGNAALEMNVGIYATSQVNEDRIDRKGGRLHQGDMKNAKAIGESARVVLMFQRPHADDKAGDARPCEVLFQIEKNNEGTTGDYPWHFDEVTQTFTEGSGDTSCRHALKHPAPNHSVREEQEPTLFASGGSNG